MNEITQEQMEELFKFLQGEAPEGWIIAHPPQLTPEQAFSLIYYLQESLRILPDSYEICSQCGDIFNSDNEGVRIDSDSHPDEWHERFGVTAEDIKATEGKHFCDESCEARFWHKWQREKEQAK